MSYYYTDYCDGVPIPGVAPMSVLFGDADDDLDICPECGEDFDECDCEDEEDEDED